MLAFLSKWKHLLFPAAVGIVGGCLIGYFSASNPALVGLLGGAALAVSAYRRPPMI